MSESINEHEKWPTDKDRYDRNYLRLYGKVCPECGGRGGRNLDTECYKCKGFGYIEKIRHGITKDQYEELFQNQNGECAICEESLGKTLAVDHNHKTGMIRGLLCHKCNMALGIVEDKIKAVINYLNKPTTMKWSGKVRMK